MNRHLVLITALTALCFTLPAFAQNGERGLPTKEYLYKTIGEKDLKVYVDFPRGWMKTDTRPVIVFLNGGSWRGATRLS
ncbi:MAG: hypothetical protein ACJ07L_06715 [Opitutales bacterium]|jgi:hypothetical protein